MICIGISHLFSPSKITSKRQRPRPPSLRIPPSCSCCASQKATPFKDWREWRYRASFNVDLAHLLCACAMIACVTRQEGRRREDRREERREKNWKRRKVVGERRQGDTIAITIAKCKANIIDTGFPLLCGVGFERHRQGL
mmetsp:Transcript_17406/g.43367  ORF Transcript_17406/g.43367 Transcript_17406/m.43367 type:complete len:140 (+) Transcript_17406:1300-1719(+)